MEFTKHVIRVLLILPILGLFVGITYAFNIIGLIIALMFTLQIIIILQLRDLKRKFNRINH